jgi:hypothetical protein
MTHTTSTDHSYRERIGAHAFVRTAVPSLDGLPSGPRRLPARLRRPSVVRVPPA